MLQAFIDESGKGDPDLLVLGGYVSSADSWQRFNNEWQRVLDMKSPHYRQLEYFKMAEMASEADRERCAWFHSVIENHAMAAISYTISTRQLKREVARMFPEEPDMQRALSNPWHFAVHVLIRGYAENRKNVNLPEGPIDLTFDDVLHEKGVVVDNWEQYKAINPDIAHLMGSVPQFKSDKEVLPLQAADLFAWWVREWQKGGALKGADIYKCEFPWPRKRPLIWTHILTDKYQIRARLREIRDARRWRVVARA